MHKHPTHVFCAGDDPQKNQRTETIALPAAVNGTGIADISVGVGHFAAASSMVNVVLATRDAQVRMGVVVSSTVYLSSDFPDYYNTISTVWVVDSETGSISTVSVAMSVFV